VNVQNFLLTLAFGYAPDESTCFKEIHILPPGRIVELENRGVKEIETSPWLYGDRHAGEANDKKFAALDELFDEAITFWQATSTGPTAVSLSGGYDSQYCLALLLKRGLLPVCATFGHPRSHDGAASRRLCTKLGLEHYPYYRKDSSSWEQWQDLIQHLGATGGIQFHAWAGDWLRHLGSLANKIVLGYLGDALSGKHLPGTEHDERKDWLETWINWSAEEGWLHSSLLRPGVRLEMSELTRDVLASRCNIPDLAFPHQKALHLDLYGRQRRLVAAQPNLFSRFMAPMTPFYTPRLLEFWSNLAWTDLHAQSLYRAYAEDRFPSIFTVPAAKLSERLWGAASNLVGEVSPALRARMQPPEINRYTILADNRDDIDRLLLEVGPWIDDYIDVTAVRRNIRRFPRGELNAVQIVRLVNMLMLLRLASKDGSNGRRP
jgi:hypothetical protein